MPMSMEEKNDHFIRNAEAGLANGQLPFEADITETKTEDPQIRLNAKLSNSHSEQAMAAFSFSKNQARYKQKTAPSNSQFRTQHKKELYSISTGTMEKALCVSMEIT